MINPKKFEIPSKITYKLDRMRLASALLDQPELGRKTILVAGTNGKGSTVQYLTSLFLKAGLKVGTYTSPHVVSRTERIRINSKNISEFELKKFEKKYASVLEPLTYFERMTALAFLIFREKRVDIQVLEVGLGGRLDATNISDPDFSVITSIDYDHQEILGNKLSQIAKEKAGIMRKGRICFSAPQSKEAAESLRIEARIKGSRMEWASKAKNFSKPLEKVLARIKKDRGLHQEINARLALNVFQEAAFEWHLDFNFKKIIAALKGDLLLARIQCIRKKPLFLVDGAHNQAAVTALLQSLKKNYPKQKFDLVFGLMDDKKPAEVIRILKPLVSRVFLVKDFYPERQMSVEKLKSFWKKKDAEVITNLSLGLKALWKSKKAVLVAGSFYLAGAVLKDLKKMKVIS